LIPDQVRDITSVSGNNYAYDLNGNLTTGDPVWSFSYDAENKLKTATASNGATVAMAYQPDNLLTSTTESSGNVTTSFLGACPREGGGWRQSGGGI
jgi:uncharacterized protein RhaS with RHS repeats